MPRVVPESRLKELLACAQRVFIEQGYRRTQVADVAKALGVAKGTVYLSVESKEALFVACLRYADQEPPRVSELDLPLAAPEPEELLHELEARLEAEAVPPALERALERQRVTDAARELEEILRQLFQASARHRTAIKLMDRCGRDHPELAAAFYAGGRFTQLEALTRYLESRIRRGRFPAVPDVAVAARFVIETIATWAVHIHWDPAPQPIAPDVAEQMVVQLLLRGLVGTAP